VPVTTAPVDDDDKPDDDDAKKKKKPDDWLPPGLARKALSDDS
jgi:hypothetical protein